MEGLPPFCDGGDCGSLFFGGNEDMESLFGGDDERPMPLPALSSEPETSLLALPDTPFAVPADSTLGSAQHRDSDVSTLPEPQQCADMWSFLNFPSFPLPDTASAIALYLDQEEEELRELEQMLAAEQERERELHGEEDGESQSRQDGPLQQPVDTLHSEAGLSAEPASRPSQSSQDGEGHVVVEVEDEDDGDDGNDSDDVIFVGQSKVNQQAHQQVNQQAQALRQIVSSGHAVVPAYAAPALHYLELRPRCPNCPPPPNIHLRDRSIEELLPYVQLDTKLSLQSIYVMLDISLATGKLIKNECRQHLAEPEHAIHPSGTKDPVALRIRKVVILLSSLAFLSELGMGERWFGRQSSLNPRSKHVWPDDSTTLTLLFVKLLYKIQRSADAKQRQKPDKTASRERGGVVIGSTAFPSPALSPQGLSISNFPHNSPSCLRERLVAAQKRDFSELDEPALTESSVSRSSSVVSVVTSAPSPASSVTSATPTCSLTSLDSSVRNIETTGRPAKKRQQLNATVVSYLAKAPDGASIRYFINITQGCQRVLPQLVLGHKNHMRTAGYSFIKGQCAAMGYEVASVAVCTLLGLEEVANDQDWDRAVCRVHDAMLMDNEVRVLVTLGG